jgi:replicative DNA helicase
MTLDDEGFASSEFSSRKSNHEIGRPKNPSSSFSSGGIEKFGAVGTLPYNIDAEQGLLGILLLDNMRFDKVAEVVEESHFYDPLHQRIFKIIHQRIQSGKLATPMTLKPYFESDLLMRDLPDGAGYLATLAAAALSVSEAQEFAQIIRDLAIHRDLYRIGMELSHKAIKLNVTTDVDVLISDTEMTLYELAEKKRYGGGFQKFSMAVTEAVKTANSAYRRDSGLSGLASGFVDLDRKLGGLHPSDLIIVAGRPSMGKTAFVTNLAFAIAQAHKNQPPSRGNASKEDVKNNAENNSVNGGVVGFFSLEMSAEQLASRILSEQSTITSDKIRRGEMDEEEFKRFVYCAKAIERVPLFVDDTPALTLATLAARARRLKRQHGLDLVIIDYLQLLRSGHNRPQDNRVQEVSLITQGLKALAKELHVPVIALSQLSRQVENRDDKRPQLADLRESGSIEQDSDVVMFIYREEYYVARAEPTPGTEEYVQWQKTMGRVHNMAEIIIGKQRHGPIGTVKLMFDSAYTRFSNHSPL